MDEDFSAHGDLESNTDEQSNADSASLAVVKQEIKMMNVVRTFVFALMITFSTITAEVVYVLVRIGEENTFTKEFKLYANDLIEGFYNKMEKQLIAAESLSASMTLSDFRADWPYMSFHEFEMRCANDRQLAEASSVTYSPLIQPQTLDKWQQYAVYMDGSGFLDSNHTDDYQTPYGNSPNASVYYIETNRTVGDGIYSMVKGEPVDILPANELPTDTILLPLWQRTPTVTDTEVRMYDQHSNPARAHALDAILESPQEYAGAYTDFLIYDTNLTDYAYYPTPRASLYVPIHQTVDKASPVVGTLDLEFPWETFLGGILDDGLPGMIVVVENSCSSSHHREYSFSVNGTNVTYLGVGDYSTDPELMDAPDPLNSTYHDFLQVLLLPTSNTSTSNTTTATAPSSSSVPCAFRIHIYATVEMKEFYLTNNPEIYRWVVLGVFLFVVSVFLIYDCIVDARSNAVVESAKRTDALVSTLFPSNVKQRLLENADKKRKAAEERTRLTNWQINVDRRASTISVDSSDDGMMMSTMPMIHTPKRRLKSILLPGEGGVEGLMAGEIDDSEPIADLFPNASVMFADVAGFTAWSSERDPSQVFKLLETLYRSMDKAARRFRIFKVETIGDCYVAAAGLPDQREDHVEAITRFARTCLLRTNELTKALESTLGPGTSELALRFGIHSGPVTAGVLRGEKARFQLFGDTMNFAARMESTGLKNKIHLSQSTAEILIRRGKPHWVAPRGETVYAKGKGELKTYWLQLGSSTNSNRSGGSSISDVGSVTSNTDQSVEFGPGVGMAVGTPESVLKGVIGETKLNRSIDRLVEWNSSALLGLLKKVVISRGDNSIRGAPPEQKPSEIIPNKSRSFMDELLLNIPLPGYDAEAVARVHENDVKIPRKIQNELRMYVAAIASGYRKNAFHNFEHASHVILSATKLLKRISYADGHVKEDGVTTEDLHHYTYGISSDPLTQFAVVFAALIHDVGHEGVPNGQLATELPHIAAIYDNKSIAEQRSVDVALELLMLPKYTNLRECICGDESGQKRFRQLLIHCVLATDIFEKDLKAKRNLRWEQAFHPSASAYPLSEQEDMNCKATIVLEHIIQASDVSHCMQHWHVYIKWNERLYEEMYTAYKTGRSNKDPSEGWYKGEMWFYDNYVIPLAKKLKECGVFGVSSDEYLTYAVQNRTEWETRGEELCEAMKTRVEREFNKKKKIEAVPEGDEPVYREVYRDESADFVVGDNEDEPSTHSYNEH